MINLSGLIFSLILVVFFGIRLLVSHGFEINGFNFIGTSWSKKNENKSIPSTTTNTMDLKMNNNEFKSSKPEIYGKYAYIVTGENSKLNLTTNKNTFYGDNTVLETGTNSNVNWKSEKDEFGKKQSQEVVNIKNWYEKPFGIILLSIISGLIISGVVYLLKWN